MNEDYSSLEIAKSHGYHEAAARKLYVPYQTKGFAYVHRFEGEVSIGSGPTAPSVTSGLINRSMEGRILAAYRGGFAVAHCLKYHFREYVISGSKGLRFYDNEDLQTLISFTKSQGFNIHKNIWIPCSNQQVVDEINEALVDLDR